MNSAKHLICVDLEDVVIRKTGKNIQDDKFLDTGTHRGAQLSCSIYLILYFNCLNTFETIKTQHQTYCLFLFLCVKNNQTCTTHIF